ncbi:hypothetical protein QJS10_CPB21g01326 [Acorus calamus]|uniref:Reverse transcriptase zinc-binding domain-containing protein n=1 Tax=Acorus calamus TaxID=4465 RepID=A0AAV9C8N8_ACOCL|nr:hypothetical protein QJS10_CPB21g01326 [Acorus calamus]
MKRGGGGGGANKGGGRLLMKAYRVKWQPNESDMCALCSTERETVEHLFCVFLFTRQVWDTVAVETGLDNRFTSMEGLWKAGVALQHQVSRGRREVSNDSCPGGDLGGVVCLQRGGI